MSQIFSYTISDKKKSYSDYIKNKKENNIEGKIKVIEKEKQDPKSDTTKKKKTCVTENATELSNVRKS
jgi:hypothetical protein